MGISRLRLSTLLKKGSKDQELGYPRANDGLYLVYIFNSIKTLLFPIGFYSKQDPSPVSVMKEWLRPPYRKIDSLRAGSAVQHSSPRGMKVVLFTSSCSINLEKRSRTTHRTLYHLLSTSNGIQADRTPSKRKKFSISRGLSSPFELWLNLIYLAAIALPSPFSRALYPLALLELFHTHTCFFLTVEIDLSTTSDLASESYFPNLFP